MYSDILRSKRSLGWRTCLVIPELKEEVESLQKHKEMDIECVGVDVFICACIAWSVIESIEQHALTPPPT